VLDGDGDSTNYDLAAGDQPAISGDQMLWWVMNDVGNRHEYSLTPPIGLEVHVSAFAFGQGPAALRQATFYRLRLHKRSPGTLERAYVTFWSDPDLGDAADDYTGADTTRDLSYWYNADNQDGNGSGGTYGVAPPAVGIQLLQGPVGTANGRDDDGDGTVDEPGERLRMTASIGGWDSPPSGGPFNGVGMYRRMQGRWNDGTPITEGGYGYGGGAPVTTYTFPGDPTVPHYWSERCPNLAGPCNPHASGDRHAEMSSGPWTLGAGEWQEVLFAIPYGRGTDHIDSIVWLRRAATQLRNAYDAGLLEAVRMPGFVLEPGSPRVGLRRPSPNPFDVVATIELTLPAAAGVRVALVDVLGREVAVLADGPHEAGVHPIEIAGAGLAPGVYLARVWVAGQPAGALPLTRR
jgi:hypothetical protein